MYWFESSFRRHLLDMHITDWGDGVFLSKFSPEEYYENLKRANVKSAMIYLQSHVGYCYYPTKNGHIHPAFISDPDKMKRLVDLCHQGGIEVIAYYSINYNALESRAHPEWTVVRADKKSHNDLMFSGDRYRVCCPNNPEYLQFMLDQVTEMLTFVDADGINFDMPFWLHPCHCEHCVRKYKEEFGKEIPTVIGSKEWDEFVFDRDKWTDEYIGKLSAHAKKVKPGISVQFNYAYAALNAAYHIPTEVINKHQDYASGDIYVSVFTQSFACKLYGAVTQNKPFEFMFSRCDPNLSAHTNTKSDDKLRVATLITTAHHGANFIIDAVDPVGTMDKRFYEKLGELYREVEHYEPYLKTGDLVTDVGLFYCLEARSTDREKPRDENDHYNSTIAVSKALTRMHIPYSIITQQSAKNLENYKVIVLSNPKNLSSETVMKLKKYVENGGKLYISGSDDKELIEVVAGVRVEGFTKQDKTYVAPKENYEKTFADFNSEYPLQCSVNLPIVKVSDDAEVLATISLPFIHPEYEDAYSSIHSNPPGTKTDYPAVIKKQCGKGEVIWSAAGIEARYLLACQKIFSNLLADLGLDTTIKTTASRNTEIITFKAENEILVSAVYLTDDEVTEIQNPFTVSVKSEKAPKAVTLLADGSKAEFDYKDGFITFKTRELNIFDMYRIELQ